MIAQISYSSINWTSSMFPYSSTFSLEGNNEDFLGIGIPGCAWPYGKLNSGDHYPYHTGSNQ